MGEELVDFLVRCDNLALELLYPETDPVLLLPERVALTQERRILVHHPRHNLIEFSLLLVVDLRDLHGLLAVMVPVLYELLLENIVRVDDYILDELLLLVLVEVDADLGVALQDPRNNLVFLVVFLHDALQLFLPVLDFVFQESLDILIL